MSTFGTELRIQQTQILAPQLQQSLKLLQVPALELQTLLAQQLACSPVLEEYDPTRDAEYSEVEQFTPDEQDLADEREARAAPLAEPPREDGETDSEQAFEKQLDTLTRDNEEWQSYYDNTSVNMSAGGRAETVEYHERRPNDDELYLHRLNSIETNHSLVDELEEQFGACQLEPGDGEIVEYILGSLDSNGFLSETAEEIAATLHKEPAQVARLIALLRAFDPPGIGARDLRDCLLLQLERRGLRDSLPYRLLQEYYQELLHNRLEHIAHKLQVPIGVVQAAIKDIATLDPKPGRDLSTALAPAIKPDVIVTRDEDGNYTVETNDNVLPYVRINPRIRKMLKDKAVDKPTAQYLRNSIREGETLLNNLQFRKRTVLAVAEAIVAAQREFFDEGPMHLKPLSMKEIAEKVGVHEATISRTVNGKYMDTPQGLFEMRYFFTAHVTDDRGNEISTSTVKTRLKQLIDEENKRDPLSDDALAAQLRAENFPVARRTVVKYRQALGIPNTRQRKVFG
jgi:RNA polymerase sigma-54 factor